MTGGELNGGGGEIDLRENATVFGAPGATTTRFP